MHMADRRIVAFLSLLDLVFCEVVQNEIYLETGSNCSIGDLSVISSMNMSAINQKYFEDQVHGSNFSYSCSSNDSTRLCFQ